MSIARGKKRHANGVIRDSSKFGMLFLRAVNGVLVLCFVFFSTRIATASYRTGKPVRKQNHKTKTPFTARKNHMSSFNELRITPLACPFYAIHLFRAGENVL